MPLLTRTAKGSKLSISEMDGNLEYVNTMNTVFRVMDGLKIQVNARDNLYTSIAKVSHNVVLRFARVSESSHILIYDFSNIFPTRQVTITDIQGASVLTSLEDIGTAAALDLRVCNITSAAVIDGLFTQLPTTSKTATIDVSGNSGASGCTPSIATNKGYTVTT